MRSLASGDRRDWAQQPTMTGVPVIVSWARKNSPRRSFFSSVPTCTGRRSSGLAGVPEAASRSESADFPLVYYPSAVPRPERASKPGKKSSFCRGNAEGGASQSAAKGVVSPQALRPFSDALRGVAGEFTKNAKDSRPFRSFRPFALSSGRLLTRLWRQPNPSCRRNRPIRSSPPRVPPRTHAWSRHRRRKAGGAPTRRPGRPVSDQMGLFSEGESPIASRTSSDPGCSP